MPIVYRLPCSVYPPCSPLRPSPLPLVQPQPCVGVWHALGAGATTGARRRCQASQGPAPHDLRHLKLNCGLPHSHTLLMHLQSQVVAQ
jgi:hypothetical protein